MQRASERPARRAMLPREPGTSWRPEMGTVERYRVRWWAAQRSVQGLAADLCTDCRGKARRGRGAAAATRAP